ncbi:hypothetical protein EST38_g458 [Candolleomyces aberdarensis]|uniref:Acyl-protein thioesterase 1 n=1 Tax=Candolleomyces aberdarensis TaxID=2316362 RepID=A0A4V1Q5F7_9AGAR|nr:hypothetical protein EST38_g458 [Candolleomyces aberdarensis]
MGIEMPSWFNIISFGFTDNEDEAGMLDAARSINQLITTEVDEGLDSRRIVLGGFSQGGTMSLLTGLTGERKLGGLVVLSGWIPLRHKFKAMASPHATSTPIFWGHGTIDPLVKPEMSTKSEEFVTKEVGVPVQTDKSGIPKGLDYRLYDGLGHSTNMQELEDTKAWLIRALPAVDTPAST